MDAVTTLQGCLRACLTEGSPLGAVETLLAQHLPYLVMNPSAALAQQLHQVARRVRQCYPENGSLAERCHRAALAATPGPSLEEVESGLKRALDAKDLEGALSLVELGGNLDALEGDHGDEVKWLRNFRDVNACTVAELEDYAIGLGIGYKAANILVMRYLTLTQPLDLEVLRIEIPRNLFLTDLELRLMLEKMIPGRVQTLWSQFVAAGGPANPAARNALTCLRKEVVRAFKRNGFVSQRLSRWLQSTDGRYLIVRSAGKEDSATFSNAGGNLTVPFVRPWPQKIARALGEVIASYFGERSIGQRWAAGDKTLLTEPPFIPVAIQEMVTELNPEEPALRSGVMFTYDPSGDPDRTLIQSGLGYTDGLVSGRVLADTYYVGSDLQIHAITRRKGLRTVKKGHELVEAEVSHSAAAQRSLTDPQVRDLKRVAHMLSRAYGTSEGDAALDIEFSVRDNTLFLFQTRPLVRAQRARPVSPSFVDLSRVFMTGQTVSWELTVSIMGYPEVRRLDAPQHGLFCEDPLEAALSYGKDTRTIFVKRGCEETAHAAVMLKGTGLPVLVARPEVWNRLRELNDKVGQERYLLVCPQRGRVVYGGKELGDAVRPGSVTYPMQRQATVEVTADDPAQIEKRYHRLLELLGDADERLKRASPSTLLESLTQADYMEGRQLLKALLLQIQNTLAVHMRSGVGENHKEIVATFCSIIDLAEGQLLPALRNSPPQSMARLFPIRILETLIFQEPNESVVNSFSIKSALSFARLCQTWGSRPLKAFASQAFSPHCATAWCSLIDSIDSADTDSDRRLKRMVVCLARFKMLPLWLNTIFLPLSGTQAPADLVLTLYKMWFQDAKLIAQIEEDQKILRQWRLRLCLWGKTSGKARFGADLIEFCATLHNRTLLRQRYESAGTFGRLVLLGHLQDCTDVVDLSIKELIVNPECSPRAKVRLMAELVNVMHEMMLGHLSLNDAWKLEGQQVDAFIMKGAKFPEEKHNYYSDASFNGLGLAEILVQAKSDDGDPQTLLSCRPEFDARPLVLGSKVSRSYGVHMPRSLPEHHTVLHQNILCMQGRLIAQLGLDAHALAPQAATLAALVSSRFQESVSHIGLKEGRVEALIVLPLRQHSCELKISYHPRHLENGVEVSLHAFGADEHARWVQLACVGALLGYSAPETLSMRSPPKLLIDAMGRTQVVNWSIGIAVHYPNTDQLVEALHWTLQTMTMSHHENTFTIIDKLRTFLPDIGKLNEGYRHIPYMIPQLINDAVERSMFCRATMIAAHGLIGLKLSNMKDFTKIDPVPNATSSLASYAEAALKSICKEQGIGLVASRMLEEAGIPSLGMEFSPDKLAEELALLKVESDAPPEKAPPKSVQPSGKLTTNTRVYAEHPLKQAAVSGAAHLKVASSATLSADLFSHAANVLKGYGEVFDSSWSAGKFPGLEKYLGKPHYSLVPNNTYDNTSKPYKAACFHMIRGLESDNEATRTAALSAYASVVSYYATLDYSAAKAHFVAKLIAAIKHYGKC